MLKIYTKTKQFYTLNTVIITFKGYREHTQNLHEWLHNQYKNNFPNESHFAFIFKWNYVEINMNIWNLKHLRTEVPAFKYFLKYYI